MSDCIHEGGTIEVLVVENLTFCMLLHPIALLFVVKGNESSILQILTSEDEISCPESKSLK